MSSTASIGTPRIGRINFHNASMRYGQGLPLAIRGIELVIRDGGKLSIVSRAGPGRSSTVAAVSKCLNA